MAIDTLEASCLTGRCPVMFPYHADSDSDPFTLRILYAHMFTNLAQPFPYGKDMDVWLWDCKLRPATQLTCLG